VNAAVGAWVYEDVNSDDYETDSYAQVPSGPLNPPSGLLSGLLGRGGAQVGLHLPVCCMLLHFQVLLHVLLLISRTVGEAM
jgi:hypothetical protein